ncbi:MAG: AAA family ATPase [Acidobacteriota bacterium]
MQQSCSKCSFETPASMRFCVHCGYQMSLTCASCGAEMLRSYSFCGECGEDLTAALAAVRGGAPQRPRLEPQLEATPNRRASPPTPQVSENGGVLKEGERKQVTVLRCELSAPEGVSPSPDELHQKLSAFFELADEEVRRFGGTVQRFLGQGFMALFGAPVAFEDHPRRALLSARALRERLRGDGDGGALEGWSVRMGIDTGAVVLGGGVGGMAVGEATEAAAALEARAESGEILVGAATARAVRGVLHLEALPAEPGDAGGTTWSVSEELEAGPMRAFTEDGGATPFVGRRNEISVLEQLRDKAQEGRGQVVAVAGEAGSGKSRLLHELYRRTFPGPAHKASYLRGQCVSYGTGVPYLPLADMVRKASRISQSDAPQEAIRKLAASLRAVGTDTETTLPFLLRLLGIQQGTEALDEMEPQAIQARTFAAMRRMLLDASRRALVVLEIEDVQWIDATSAEFLDSLIEVMAPARLMVVLTFRSGYQPQWLEKSYATLLSAGPLSRSESHSLVAALLERSGVEHEPPEELLEKAEGNPFFLEELARALVETSGDASHEGLVPSTVQDVLMARIDRLPESHKRLLRAASVLGRELSLELLESVWEEAEDLEGLLEDLQRWELISRAPSEDKPAFLFRQALIQEVTYQSLLAGQKERLHGLAAAALEEIYARRLEDAFDLLAYHYPRSGQPEKTVHYLTLFATRAAEAFAHSEGAQALREALAQVELLPEEGRDRRLVEVLLQLAESLLPLASFAETLELFQKYRSRLEALQDPKLAGPFYFWLAHTFTYMGLPEETREFADLSIAAAQQCGDEITEGKACYVLGRDGFWSGDYGKGIEMSLRAVVLLERNSEPWWQGQAYWVAGFNHYVLGDFEPAIEALERAFALGEALDDYRLDTSWSLGYFYASLGEVSAGIEQCQRGLERSQDPLNTAVSTGFLGHALLQEGREIARAVDNLERATDLMAGAGMQQLEGWFAALLSEALAAEGRSEDARAAARRGLKAAEEAGFWYGVGLAEKSLGRIALETSEMESAEELLESARTRFDQLRVPFEVAQVDLELGRLARLAGKPGEAASRLESARASFEQLSVPFWVDQAERASLSA